MIGIGISYIDKIPTFVQLIDTQKEINITLKSLRGKQGIVCLVIDRAKCIYINSSSRIISVHS